jgi:hypothetical protein
MSASCSDVFVAAVTLGFDDADGGVGSCGSGEPQAFCGGLVVGSRATGGAATACARGVSSSCVT